MKKVIPIRIELLHTRETIDTVAAITDSVDPFYNHKTKIGSAKMRQTHFKILGKDKDIKIGHWRVLSILISELKFGNFIQVGQKYIADELSLHSTNVCKIMRDLVNKGIILEGGKVHRFKTYALNPEYGYKGSNKNHIVALAKYRKSKVKELKEA
jgi:hypothetical protein